MQKVILIFSLSFSFMIFGQNLADLYAGGDLIKMKPDWNEAVELSWRQPFIDLSKPGFQCFIYHNNYDSVNIYERAITGEEAFEFTFFEETKIKGVALRASGLDSKEVEERLQLKNKVLKGKLPGFDHVVELDLGVPDEQTSLQLLKDSCEKLDFKTAPRSW